MDLICVLTECRIRFSKIAIAMRSKKMPEPCPKCGRRYVWDGTRCAHKECRFGSDKKAIRQAKKLDPVPPPTFEFRWHAVRQMESADIERAICGIRSTQFGWSASIPAEFGTFFGVSITLVFETRPIAQVETPPVATKEEQDLARTILTHLIAILQEAESRFEAYHSQVPEALSLVARPRIWIYREEPKGPHFWTFVVGAKGAPDFGCHIEFHGIEFHDIWAGD